MVRFIAPDCHKMKTLFTTYVIFIQAAIIHVIAYEGEYDYPIGRWLPIIFVSHEVNLLELISIPTVNNVTGDNVLISKYPKQNVNEINDTDVLRAYAVAYQYQQPILVGLNT